MKISRRDFLKWCSASAVAIGVTKMELDKLESIVMAAETTPPVIWLQGSGCSGCTVSLLNAVENTTIDDLLLNKVSMKYHSNLMVAAGQSAMSVIDDAITTYNGKFILVIEGGISTADNGIYCMLGERNGSHWTMLDAVKELAPHAQYIIGAGTCAAFGGVGKLGSNPTGITNLASVLNRNDSKKLINLPGCPVHPYTLTKTIVDLLLYGPPKLTTEKSPIQYYSTSVHKQCPFRGTAQVSELGQSGCLKGLGCKGPIAKYDCPNRKWNNKTNWCIGAGHPCIKCSRDDFGAESFYSFR